MAHFKMNKLTALASLAILASSSLSTLAYANETDIDVDQMCDRQSISIANELSSQSTDKLTEREISFIRSGAVSACQETYKQFVNSAETPSPEKVVVAAPAAAPAAAGVVDQNDNAENTSIFDGFFTNKEEEDLSPIQKMHRTGGK